VRRRLIPVLALLVACRATTGRPSFVPFPEAETVEIGFGLADRTITVMRVTDTVVAYLKADSIPIALSKPFDGYFETAWLDAKTLTPTSRRPLGDGVVRVRGFVDPSKPGYANVNIETVYRRMVDPSVPARELEAPVPTLHPVNHRIAELMKKLQVKYGIPEEPKKTGPVRPGGQPPLPGAKSDTTAKGAKPDTTAKGAKPDTTIKAPKKDTTSVKPGAR